MYLQTCKFDCCNQDVDSCNCKSMEAYSRTCMDQGVRLNWRKTDRCRKIIFILSDLKLLINIIYTGQFDSRDIPTSYTESHNVYIYLSYNDRKLYGKCWNNYIRILDYMRTYDAHCFKQIYRIHTHLIEILVLNIR